jgi:superfamily II DNA/RNA helicase
VAISLVSEEEEKYFAEIEKLIKKSIPREMLSISNTNRMSSKQSNKRNQNTYTSQTNQKRKSHDPWFDKPYVPEKNSKKTANTTANATPKNRNKQIATLLGGLNK